MRFAAISVVAVIALGIVARLILPTILVAVGNRELSRRLATPARLNAIDLGLLDYRITLQDLSINQPDGFGDDLFLDLPDARVKLVISSLFDSPLTIEEMAIADLSVHVVRDEDGTLNVNRLLQPAAAKTEAAKARKPVHIKRIAVNNLTIRYTDLALNEAPVHVTINRFDAVITDVYLDRAETGKHPLPGRAEMTGYFAQPGFADAPLGIIARFGHIDTTRPIPAARTAIRLAGVEIQPWHALLPPGMSQAIGGNIMDVNVDAVFSTDALDCTVAIVTPAGDALKLELSGTPRQPQVEQNGIRGIVVDRAQEAGFNTLGNIGDTGEELGRTALSAAGAAGKGAATTVWGTVTGLFKTASSVSKGNMAEGGANLVDATWGTVTNAGAMIGNTGVSLAAGGVLTASATVGGDRNELWRADTQQRWARSWVQARKSVEKDSGAEHDKTKVD